VRHEHPPSALVGALVTELVPPAPVVAPVPGAVTPASIGSPQAELGPLKSRFSVHMFAHVPSETSGFIGKPTHLGPGFHEPLAS
jgi:hypothetical protein